VCLFKAEEFKVVIQQQSNVMVGTDKQIPVMCLVDLSDLEVSNSLNVTYVTSYTTWRLLYFVSTITIKHCGISQSNTLVHV